MAKLSELNMKVDIDVSEALTGLKAVQREAKEAARALKEVEVKQSPFSIGDRIVCNWGGPGKTGVVVDSIVRYNNYMTFSEENYEPACIIRFDPGQKTHLGSVLGKNEVVPHREIRKA